MIGNLTGKHILKWSVVALAALAFATATKAWSELSNDVILTYHAPPGDLTINIFDPHGERLRRTVFSPRLRTHEVVLPTGRYRVEMIPKGKRPQSHWFTVSEDELSVTLRYDE
ncbi:MAG: hypothetical protein CMH52_09660 [Myxococcales bacterium]|nr:hypothetical protein [Myxococcales bacterium]|tara:strand:- start:69 stop:407 length:339 start_codon:yes stop_codon:yes gene_type:complete